MIVTDSHLEPASNGRRLHESELLGKSCQGDSHSVNLSGTLPAFNRVTIEDLIERGHRSQARSKLFSACAITSGLAFGAVVGVGITIGTLAIADECLPYFSGLGNFLTFNAALLLGGFAGREAARSLLGYCDKMLLKINADYQRLQEAQSLGVVCECSYPILDLDCCPECGPASEVEVTQTAPNHGEDEGSDRSGW